MTDLMRGLMTRTRARPAGLAEHRRPMGWRSCAKRRAVATWINSLMQDLNTI
jgi:hypothetical protein